MSDIDSFLNDKKTNVAVAPETNQIDSFLSDAPAKDKGILGHVRDTALSLAKSAVAVPETAVGLLDMVSYGKAGKALENKDGAIGFRPKEAKEFLSNLQTDQFKAQQQQFSDADGIGDKVGVALSNPTLITNSVAESLAPMLAGGVVGRGLRAVAPTLSPIASGAIGEGAMMAGGQAEQIRQQTEDGLLTGEQAAAAAATGGLGALFGYGGGRLAKRLGIGDVDTLSAGGQRTSAQIAEETARIASLPPKSIPRKVVEGAISEGFLEELPQSVSEQILQNLALNKDWSEGVEDAAVMGTLAGMAMGGGAGVMGGSARPTGLPQPTSEQPAPQAAPIVAPNVEQPTPAPTQYENGVDYEQPNVSEIALQNAGNSLSLEDIDSRRAIEFERVRAEEQAQQQQETLLGLPAPAFEVGADGLVSTSADRNAAIQAQLQAQADRQDRINRGEILDVTPIPKLSEQMGLDPNAGTMSAAAALAVDSGASQQLADQQAQQQAVETAQKQGKGGQKNAPTGDLAGAAQLAPLTASSTEVTATPADIKSITAKQIPDMSDAELQQAVAHYGPDHPRTAKLNKQIEKRGITTNEAAPAAQPVVTPNPEQAKAWNALTPLQRKQVAANTDLKPVIANNLSKTAWETLNPEVQQKLTTSMQSQNATAKPTSMPATLDGLARQYVEAHNSGDKVRKQQLISHGDAQFGQQASMNAVNDAMAKNKPSVAPKIDTKTTQNTPDAPTATQLEQKPAIGNTDTSSIAPKEGRQTVNHVQDRERILNTEKTPSIRSIDRDSLVRDFAKTSNDAEENAVYSAAIKDGYSSAEIQKMLEDAGRREKPAKAKAPASLKEGIAKAQENAKAKTNKTAPQGKKLIGQNAEGQDLFEDKNGIRSVDNGSGFLVGESVAIKPGSSQPYDTSARTDEHRTVAEIEAAKQSAAPSAAVKEAQAVLDMLKNRLGWQQGSEENTVTKQFSVGLLTASYAPSGAYITLKNDATVHTDLRRHTTTASAMTDFANKVQDYIEQKQKEAVNAQQNQEAHSEQHDFSKNKHKRLGLNNRNQYVYEDKNGVRSYVESGVRVSESVELRPTGQGMAVDVANRTNEYRTVEEINQRKADNVQPESLRDQVVPKSQTTDYGSKNTLVSVDRAAELRKKLKAKLNQLNSGIDPEILAMGAELAVFHIEAGVRKFSDFAKTMASDLDMPMSKIKTFVRSWYNGARDMMEDAGLSIEGMDSPDVVRAELAKLSDENNALDNSQNKDQNVNSAASQGKNNGQSTELGASGQGTLERVSANDVQTTTSQRNAGRETTGSSAKDTSSNDGVGGQRPSSGRSVADGSGAVSTTTRRKGTGASGQLDLNDGLDPNQVVTSQNAPDGAFNITTDDDIGGGGAKTKFKNNFAAIELLKQLEAESRPATKDEQKVLAKFVGWGGLSGAFVRDDGSYNKGWEKEAKGLEALLTDDEYKAAVDSSIAAHYTSPEIVRAMWTAVQRMGFNGGRVIEPSVGVGNFYGAMPAGLRNASGLHGVELDHITGGIAKHLYPQAKIKAPLGFQDYTFNDGHFDLAIGNPPFSSMTIHDGDRRAISGFSLHNYFFAKSIDSLREGGVLAMVVTNRLMDVSNASDKARQYMNKHAKLIGAIRLPNNAFLKNAGTEVTTDIIFLQKREAGDNATSNYWMNVYPYTDKQGKTVPLNEYFHRNPAMMLGEFGAYGSMYTPDDPALVAREGQDTAKLLNEAVAKLPERIMPAVGFQDSKSVEKAIKQDISNVKIGSVFIQDGEVMQRDPDLMGEKQASLVEGLSATAVERMKGMVGIREVLSQLRVAQLTHDVKESDLAKMRAELNTAYDAFVKKHGYINQAANKTVFHDDPSYPQIAALEDSFDKGISAAVAKSTGEVARAPSAKKAAIFSKRTQNPLAVVESVTSAKDAMVESLNRHGNIDLEHMAKLYGKPSDEIVKELGDLVYQDPIDGWVTHDQYLSGNVKQKLAQAKEQAQSDRAYGRNVEALEKVQPEDIEAIDIAVKAGAHWIPRSDIEAFLQHISGSEKPAQASYNKVSSKWTVIDFTTTEASRAQWATDHVSAQSIVEYALAQKQATVYDKHPDGSMSVNQEATIAANTKVNLVAAEWKRWIWEDEERRDRLARLYNDSFNTDVQRAYDGSHLTLQGKVDDSIIRLRPTQINAIWRMVQSDSTLADHVVGAGKTFTLIGAAMEMRRMGLANKPMFVVPNHLVGQWASDFLKLYPNANILAATKKDFEAKNRKKFIARIATGDYDAVIVAHSSFGKVKIDPKEEAAFIKEEIQELLDAEADDRAANGKNSRNAKDYAKRRLTLEEKFKKLVANENKDADNLFWHELGVDALFLDEAHEFKNLAYVTGMQRIAGLGNQKGSQKATDLFMKINSMKNNIAKSKVTFATGTPISNTMAEMYTMQRYLDLPRMKEQGIATFDAWARMFGEVVTDWELSPAGKYKMNSRFSKFANMPELMQRYLSFADVINRDDIAKMGTPLNVPLIIGGKPLNIVVERSDRQAEYLGVPTTDDNGNEVYPEGSLIWRSENLPKKAEKGADNMLKIMSDARKAALDMRLIDPSAPDEPNSKVNEAVKRTIELYHKWHADKGTQLIFCDLSTPKGAVAAEKARIEELVRKADEGDEAAIEQLDNLTPDELDALNSAFSVYDDMKQKFIDQGIPEKEIAFIHDAKTDLQKEELFGKVRSGQVRILMGSTAKMGAGMNAQERLVGLHHIDAPWRPSDLEQREGRIIRQGNALRERDPTGFEVAINRYATKQTLDSRMWETLERKAKFIEQVRKGDGKQRVIEDIGGESANSAEMKAASSGNPLILEEMTLRKQVKTLEDDRSQHLRDQHRVQRSLNEARKSVPRLETSIEIGKKELSVPIPKELAITVNGKEYKQGEEGARENAGAALLSVAKTMTHYGKERKIGQYGGFELSVRAGMVDGVAVFELTSPNDRVYDVRITPDNQSPLGLVTKITNLVNDLPSMLAQAEQRLKDTVSSIPKLEAQLSKWDKQAELDEAVERHEIVIDQLRPKKKAEDKEKAAPADTESGDVKFSFAGQKAQGADLHSLAYAKQLIGEGNDAETVRQETGWHRGADAKWRFEISDDQATVKVEGDTAADVIDMAHLEAIADGRKRQTVGDLMDHAQLFAAYPALKDIPVSLMPADVKAEARIQQFATGLEIQLAGNMPRSEIVSAILHELQHAIQNREGFAMGGSRKTFISDYDRTGAQTYKRLAGEVEARNTQMRKTMTPRLRREIAPEDTADTPESKVLISFNGKDVVPSVLPNNSMRPAMTKGGLRSAFEIKFPKLVTALNKMLTRGESGQRGGVVILDSADPLRIAHDFAKKTGTPFNDAIQMFSEDGSINGFYDPKSGLTFLVGPNLDSWTGPAVLLHEMVHGQQRASLDKQAYEMIMNRGKSKNSDLNEFLDRVAARMIDAGEAGNASEATSYIVEQAVMEGQKQGFGEADNRFLSWVDSTIGQRVGDLFRSFLRMTRQWMLRNGMPISNITVTDMVSYAQAGLISASKGKVEGSQTSFSRDSLTNTPAFKKWFGDSKVVDASGKPLVVYHGSTRGGISKNMLRRTFFTSSHDVATTYSKDDYETSLGDKPVVQEVYLNIKNPLIIDANGSAWMSVEYNGSRHTTDGLAGIAKSLGHDGLIVRNVTDNVAEEDLPPSDIYVTLGGKSQIKSATDNNGDFDPTNPDIRFSRSGVRDIASKATTELNKRFKVAGKLSAWHKTVGTMYNLAERSPAFKPVFNAAQNFIDDVSFYASEAAASAPKILPKLEEIKDITKKPISAEDNKAIAKPIFEGTLLWGRDRDGTPVLVDSLSEAASKLSTDRKAEILVSTGNLNASLLKAWKALPPETFAKMIESRYETVFLKAGVVWTDDELRSLFSLGDSQIALYHEFRDAANQSLDSMTKAEMMRIGGKDVKDMRDEVMSADNATAASHLLMERLNDIAMTDPERATSLFQAAQDIKNRVETTVGLQAAGYAPLSRFGKYTVDVVEGGERQYFGLFETMYEANTMAAQLRAEFGEGNVTQGTLSADAFKLFAGITPESLELFGNMLGLESDGDKARDQAFQEYIRLTKNNRSAMKRLIHRKGIAGYSEDVGRVLASFIYSNARQTAGGLHMGDMDEAVQAIPKGQGELTDVAIKLRDYIKNPQEEAQAIRGLLFAQYLGGSVASAMVNLTQPVAVTFPYLSQYGGAKQAAAQLTKAAKQMAGKDGQFEPDLKAAMKRAEEDGTLSPQEVHQLMAQARGTGSLKSGDGTRAGDAQALLQNSMTRFSLAWGKLFGAAEQINRRVTFIAAYRIAKAQGMANADEFARHAVKETQFVYTKASKMQWGRGAVGATLMTFKTYSIAYMELMHRLWNQGEAGSPERKHGRKAALLMIATLLLLSGAGGLPFADDLDDLIDGLAQIAGYNFSSDHAKQEFLEETFGREAAAFINRGITGLPGSPLDVSGRLGMGNLLPGTGLLKTKTDGTRDVLELLGPVGDFAKRSFSGARQILSGDVVDGVLEASPVAFRNLAKGADMATTGMYRDQKGYKVLETDNLEAAMKAIGFQPASVAEIQKANFVNQSSKAFYNMQAQEIRAQWANGIFLKDPSEVQAARDAITAWNEKNPDQRMIISIASVLKKAKEMAKSKDQRIADTAPKAMRAQMREDIAQRRADALN